MMALSSAVMQKRLCLNPPYPSLVVKWIPHGSGDSGLIQTVTTGICPTDTNSDFPPNFALVLQLVPFRIFSLGATCSTLTC